MVFYTRYLFCVIKRYHKLSLAKDIPTEFKMSDYFKIQIKDDSVMPNPIRKMESKQIFLIRHAQSCVNQLVSEYESQFKLSEISSLQYSYASTDTELSELGVQQAINAIPLAHSLNLKTIVVSPLRRALRTAKILFENHPDSPRIIVHPALTENLHHAADVSSYKGSPFQEYMTFD